MSLLQKIYDYIKSGETDTENLGLEIEHFVVDENGAQIGFDEVASLIDCVGRELGAEIIYTDMSIESDVFKICAASVFRLDAV